MPEVIEACNVKVGDLIGSDDSRSLEVVGITSTKIKFKNFLRFDFDDGSSRRRITPKEKILLLCRPAV